jgi:hypothetical protein
MLNLFCAFWYKTPFRIESGGEITDYIWERGALHSRLTEGFGYGRIDKNGYNNAASLAENPNPDVLIIGSSHMEAFQMPQTKTLAYVLDGELHGLDVYSKGISGHSLLTCVKNFESALRITAPKYVVFETDTVTFSDQMIERVINGELQNVGKFGPLLIFTRIPYLRLFYTQIENLTGNAAYGQLEHPSPIWLNALIGKISTVAVTNGVTPIIFYHPHLTINNDGFAIPQINEDDLRNFATACEKNNVIFADLTETFLAAYKNEHILPHGFFNTEIGTGHLNIDGHRLAAEKLAVIISKLGAEK